MAILGPQDTIPYGDGGDISANNIKIFANFIEFGSTEQSLFETNAFTYLYLKKSQELEDGYVIDRNMATSMEVDNTRIDGSKLKMRNRTNINFVSTKNLYTMFNKETIVFTENEPLDPDKYLLQEQEVYVSSLVVPSELNQKIEGIDDNLRDAIHTLEEGKNITNYNLVNINAINSLTNSVVLFTNQPKVVLPTKLNATFDKSYGSHKIFLKGKVDGDYQDIDVKETGNNVYAWMKITPTSVNNKVVFKSNTMDRNMTLPYSFLKQYIGINKGLRASIVDDTQPYKADLWKLFLSVFELTKAFSNGFKDYQKAGTDGRSGINPEATIGGKKIGLLSGTSSREALNAIDGWIEDWKTDHPTFINSNQFKLFKVYLNMLTPYVQTSYAVGGGLNQMNKINDIFYFDLRTAIFGATNTEQTNGIASDVNNDIMVQLKSEFYDINTKDATKPEYGNLSVKSKFKEHSIYRVIDIDGIINFAELPNELQEMNIPSKPGSIAINTDYASKYYIMCPVDNQKELQAFYGGTSTKSGDKPVEVIKNGNNEIKSENKKQKEICITTNPNIFNPQAPDQNSKTDFITEQYIYDNYIKNNLSPNETLKFINGVPDISNIKKTYKKTEVKNFINEGVCQFNYNTKGTKYRYFFNDIYETTYNYTIIKTKPSKDLLFTSEDTVYDKQGYLDLIKTHFTSDKQIKELDFNYRNKNNTINNITQIAFSGIYGNEFSFVIKGKDIDGNDATFNSGNLEFHSKFNEINTITKVNF